jgi:hypothetical protein
MLNTRRPDLYVGRARTTSGADFGTRQTPDLQAGPAGE